MAVWRRGAPEKWGYDLERDRGARGSGRWAARSSLRGTICVNGTFISGREVRKGGAAKSKAFQARLSSWTRAVHQADRQHQTLVKRANGGRCSLKSSAVQVLGSCAESLSRSNFWNFVCPPTVPGAPPRRVEVEILNSTAIKVMWRSLMPGKQNGQIRGYQVHYVRVENGESRGLPLIKDVMLADAQVWPSHSFLLFSTEISSLKQLQITDPDTEM